MNPDQASEPNCESAAPPTETAPPSRGIGHPPLSLIRMAWIAIAAVLGAVVPLR